MSWHCFIGLKAVVWTPCRWHDVLLDCTNSASGDGTLHRTGCPKRVLAGFGASAARVLISSCYKNRHSYVCSQPGRVDYQAGAATVFTTLVVALCRFAILGACSYKTFFFPKGLVRAECAPALFSKALSMFMSQKRR